MCTFSYCDGSCSVPSDDAGPGRCQRDAGGRPCLFFLESDGTCAACGTEACAICGGVEEPGTLRPIVDVETRRPRGLCPACAEDEIKLGDGVPAPTDEEARKVLDGRDPEDEEETREVPPLPAAELEAERRRGPAPLTDVEAYERGRQERERELATEQESGKGAAA